MAASAAAGAKGWKAVLGYTFGTPSGSISTILTALADPVNGRYSEVSDAGRYGTSAHFAVDRRGIYDSVSDTEQESALKMMRRSSVKYVFTGDKSLDLNRYLDTNAPSTTSLIGYYALAGTRTTHDDGSADYRIVEDETVVTMHVGPAGVLTGAQFVTEAGTDSSRMTLAYTYGPQTVTLPAAAVTIPAATMATGIAYLDMAATTKRAANDGAAAAHKAAKGGKVKVASLRKSVKARVSAANAALEVAMVKAKNVTGGLRVSATNPWTKKTVAYTVKASGKKVVVAKA